MFIASRTGLLPIETRKNVQVLCLSCGVPIDLSSAGIVRVGCVVSVMEIVESEIDGQVFEKIKHKYVPVNTKGYGCKDCAYLMVKIEASTCMLNQAAMSEWLRQGKVCNSPTKRLPWIEVDPRDVSPTTTLSAYHEVKL